MSPRRVPLTFRTVVWAFLALALLGLGLGLLLAKAHRQRVEAALPAPLDRSLEGSPRFTVFQA